jgi:glycosyltransferase domain-containing protein
VELLEPVCSIGKIFTISLPKIRRPLSLLSASNHMLDRITLVVPTYGRQPYLPRLCHFYKNFPIRLVIIDGTPGTAWSSSISHSDNIEYYHKPGESIHTRVLHGLARVGTDFCALMGDDEFQLPTGLLRSIEALDGAPDSCAAIGRCLGFSASAKGVVGGVVYQYQPKIFSHHLPSRIEDFFLHYSPTMAYALWRADALRRAIYLAGMRNWGSGNLNEWIQAFCGLVWGNHVIHGSIQWLRSDENPPQQAQLERSVSVGRWCSDVQFEHERLVLFSSLREFVMETASCDRGYADALIRLAVNITLVSEGCNDELRLLGLKPGKNFQRKFETPLENLFSYSGPDSASNDEIRLVKESIILTY